MLISKTVIKIACLDECAEWYVTKLTSGDDVNISHSTQVLYDLV